MRKRSSNKTPFATFTGAPLMPDPPMSIPKMFKIEKFLYSENIIRKWAIKIAHLSQILYSYFHRKVTHFDLKYR